MDKYQYYRDTENQYYWHMMKQLKDCLNLEDTTDAHALMRYIFIDSKPTWQLEKKELYQYLISVRNFLHSVKNKIATKGISRVH